MADRNRYYCSGDCSEDEDDDEEEGTGDEDEDSCGSCSSCSTAEADDAPLTRTTTGRRQRTASREGHGDGTSAAQAVAAAAAATAADLLDARRLADLLDPERLVTVLDGCLGSEYVRGCVVETWDASLSDHLDAIAHLVLYQTPEHLVSQYVYEQLTELSAALRPPPSEHRAHQWPAEHQRRPARVDADRVYGTLRSAARSLLATRVDECCRQSMCRAVGLAVAALRANTRPVFSVENFTVEINEAANFANLYCSTPHARRICAALKDIYDAVMAGEYHPTNVLVQMAVMEKSIRAALRTLADARATAAQKTAAQRSLLAELDSICATVRMKNHGCVPEEPSPAAEADAESCRAVAEQSWACGGAPTLTARFVHFTVSPWRAPIRMYHQQSPVSMDRVLKNTVRLIEALVSELFKPCLSAHRNGDRLNGRRRSHHRHRQRRDTDVHEKQL